METKKAEIVKFNLLEEEDIEQANLIFDAMRNYVSRYFKKEIDYGLIPGCGNKPVLLKAGACKLCRLFKLRPQFEMIDKIVDYQNNLFHYHYRCHLFRFNELVGQGDGLASSKESKFNRKNLICPRCDAEGTVFKDKKTNTYYCWTKQGGCGAKNLSPDSVKKRGDIFDYNTVNTVLKISQKRALVAAVLIVCGASEYFTQDLEDNLN